MLLFPTPGRLFCYGRVCGNLIRQRVPHARRTTVGRNRESTWWPMSRSLPCKEELACFPLSTLFLSKTQSLLDKRHFKFDGLVF